MFFYSTSFRNLEPRHIRKEICLNSYGLNTGHRYQRGTSVLYRNSYWR